MDRREASAPIYMVKKTLRGLTVIFHAGRLQGIRPGAKLRVLNEEGLALGEIEIRSCSETDAEGVAPVDSGIRVGCRVLLPR